jgi:hypothetical protein
MWEKCEAPWTRTTPWNGPLDPLAAQCLQRSFAMSWAYWGHRTGNPMATCSLMWVKHGAQHLEAFEGGYSIWFCIDSAWITKLASQELLQRVQILNRQHAHLAQEQVLSSVLNAVSMISLIVLRTPTYSYPTPPWVADAKANAQSRWH